MNNKIASILITIAVPIILFLILETFIRAYILPASQIDHWGYNKSGYGDLLPNKNFVSEELPQLPYRVTTNNQGLRGVKEYSIPKSTGKIRILAVGDSFTFGPFVNEQDTYPARLEQNLETMGINAEVINAGISGYTLEDELHYVQEKGIYLQPDLIIVGIYQNDVSDYLPQYRLAFSRKSHQQRSLGLLNTIHNLLLKCATLTKLDYISSYAREKLNPTPKIKNPGVDISENLYTSYFRDLDKLITLAQQNKVLIMFLFFPSFDQIQGEKYLPQERIITKLDGKYPIVDLLPKFMNEKYPEVLYLLPANDHLSAYGNFITASAIASEITKERAESKLK